MQRIVSLVPSLTEALVHFGLIDRLVGRTRYCVEPAGTIERVETVGGTKNPNIERVVALAPDLVVVNKEENRIEDWQALVDARLEVLVTHPKNVAEAAEMIEDLGRRAGAPVPAQALARQCRESLARAEEQARAMRPLRTFCPIWRNPWMTFRRDTYIGNVLEVVGLENIFGESRDDVRRAISATAATAGPRPSRTGEPAQAVASRERTIDAQSHENAADFFEIEIDEALAREPEVIVLPDEPYVFGRKHGEELRSRGAKAQIFYVDGKDLCWYGPRIPRALERLLKITREISRI